MPHAAFEIKTPFLRYFLLFYGNITYFLNSPFVSPSKSIIYKFCIIIRFLYHLFLYLLFNWICSQPNSFRDSFLAKVSNGKPLLTQSFAIISLFYSITFATAQLHSFLWGRKIVQLLDQLHVNFEQCLMSKSQAKFLAGGLILFDNASNYLIHMYAFRTISSPLHVLWLLVQYIDHCQAMIFFRLVAYGKWATLRCLKEGFSKNDKRDKKSLLLNLVKFNSKLNHLLSTPLLTQLILYQLITIWTLCFYQLMTPLELFFLPFPISNLLVVSYFTRKIRQKLRQTNFNNGKNPLYWRHAEAIYGPCFDCRIFNLITVDAAFAVRFVLIIVNFVVLINQTT